MKYLKHIAVGALSLGIIMFLGGVGYLFYITMDLPDVEKLKEYAPPLSSRIYSADDEVLLEIGKEKRELAKLEEIPLIITNAFLSAEDSNFFDHGGVDFLGIIRAAIANLKAGKVVQGGSTITQQVAKSLLLSSERSIERKLKDMILALELEEEFSKEEILYLYLNQVYLGGGYYGVKAAVRGYFDKELKDATIAESALLAGLLVAPGKYSPYLNPEYAKKRQLYVLDRLFANEKISKEEYELAKKEEIKLQKKGASSIKASYFTDWVRQRVIELVGNEEFLTQGFEVKTTLNWKLQQVAEEAIEKGTRDIDKRQGFKGPIKNIAKEEWVSYLTSARRNLLKEVSTFTWFTNKGKLRDERDLDDEDVEGYAEEVKGRLAEDERVYQAIRAQISLANYDDAIVEGLDEEKDYEALVINYNNYQKTIFVDIGGVRGVIPFENFKWAHKREISDIPVYPQRIDLPRQVVNRGDVIHVRFDTKKLYPLSQLVEAGYRKRSLSDEVRSYLKNEKFYKMKLEQVPDVQAAIASIDPQTGSIISLVGGRDFSDSQFNRAVQSKRQPGSSFKPFIYATALERGFTPASILFDTPQALAGVDESLDWKPRNYDGKFLGPLTLRKCLEGSRNVPTITLLQRVGVENVKTFLNRNDIEIDREVDLSIALGSFGFNLLDMVSLYSIFPNGGNKIDFKSITSIKNAFNDEFFLNEHEPAEEDLLLEQTEEKQDLIVKNKLEKEKSDEKEDVDAEEGELPAEEVKRIDFISDLSGEKVYDTRLSFIMTQLLRGVIQNPGGTGRKAASLSSVIGGKTGTTNNYVDAWFVGFSRDIVTGVWTGFDDNTTLGYGETGARAALPIWKEYMEEALKELGERDFKAPNGVVNVLINPQTGKKARGSEAEVTREYFVEGTEPGGEYDTEKKYDNLGIIDDDDYYSSQQ